MAKGQLVQRFRGLVGVVGVLEEPPRNNNAARVGVIGIHCGGVFLSARVFSSVGVGLDKPIRFGDKQIGVFTLCKVGHEPSQIFRRFVARLGRWWNTEPSL